MDTPLPSTDAAPHGWIRLRPDHANEKFYQVFGSEPLPLFAPKPIIHYDRETFGQVEYYLVDIKALGFERRLAYSRIYSEVARTSPIDAFDAMGRPFPIPSTCVLDHPTPTPAARLDPQRN